MTSVEVPYSIAAALPTMAVVDVTNEIARDVAAAETPDGIAYVRACSPSWLVRVSEREAGLFADVEELLSRLVPLELEQRERMILMLLGPRAEQIPFRDGELCLGTWQRVLLFGFNGDTNADWTTTIVG